MGQGDTLPWPNINFLDPAPLPRKKSKKKPDSTWLPSDEDEELEKVLETVQSSSLPGSSGAASFYGRTKNLRSNGNLVEREGAVSRREQDKDFGSIMSDLDLKSLTSKEKARKQRHLGRDLKAAKSVSSKSKGKDKNLDEGTKALRDRMEQLKGNDAEYNKLRKMKQEENN